MIKELPKRNQPQWLKDIAAGNGEFCLQNLLVDSLYYPACGLNGTPVKFLAGNILSFVYTDYSITKEEYLDNLNGSGEDCGCRGYHTVLQREIFRKDIVPDDWVPPPLPTDPDARRRVLDRQRACRPFGHWSIWQRDRDKDEAYGPELFSLLYFAGEMSAIYDGLYCRLKIAPAILAVISPGAIGGEWESATSNDSFFKTVVSSNKAGMPKYLLNGGFGRGFYEEPCWNEYRGERIIQLPERYAGLWKLANR
jgi:hypothetical protein